MTIDLDLLEARAKAATPGPWKNVDTPAMSVCDEIHDANGTRIAMALTTRHPRDGEQFIDFDQAEANAAYIAAVSPAVVLGLIAELRKLRAELEYLGELHTEATVALRNKEIDIMLADNVSNLLAGSQWAGPIPKPEEKK